MSLLSLLCFRGDGGKELVHVLASADAFRCAVGGKVCGDAGTFENEARQSQHVGLLYFVLKSRHHVVKTFEGSHRTSAGFESHLFGCSDDLPKTFLCLQGGFAESGQRGVPDASSGIVDDSEEGFVVVRVGNEAEIGKNVFDFLSLIEGLSAIDLIGHTDRLQCFLKGAALCVGAVEHGNLAGGDAASHQAPDVSYRQSCFLSVVHSGEDVERFSFLAGGIHLLGNLSVVVCNDAVGGFNDVGGGAIVALQFERSCFGVALCELENIGDFRSSETVDALCVIADDADV